MRPSREARITRRFEQRSAWWDHIDQEASLEGRMLRRRQRVALTWVEQLSLSYPAGLRVLEIGCGAGATAVELARRGHLVTALDRSPAMLERTRNHALISGVGELVTPILGDAHRLLFPTGTFDLVLAGGVLSWLKEPEVASEEIRSRPARGRQRCRVSYQLPSTTSVSVESIARLGHRIDGDAILRAWEKLAGRPSAG
jgi:ubiquinone/menaquinone biosynthesis C-methylase UbiE